MDDLICLPASDAGGCLQQPTPHPPTVLDPGTTRWRAGKRVQSPGVLSGARASQPNDWHVPAQREPGPSPAPAYGMCRRTREKHIHPENKNEAGIPGKAKPFRPPGLLYISQELNSALGTLALWSSHIHLTHHKHITCFPGSKQVLPSLEGQHGQLIPITPSCKAWQRKPGKMKVPEHTW